MYFVLESRVAGACPPDTAFEPDHSACGAAMNKPNCVIIGAAKAGTTSLYVYLSEHPEIFLPQQLKEINYFSGANDRIKTESEYLSLYNGSEKFPVRMDISTTYLYDAETPKKIRELLGPDVKIIAFLRNPVDASNSLWKQMKHFGVESLAFDDAIAAESGRIHDPEIRARLTGWAPNFFYTERFKYSPQLERYLDCFPRDQVRIYIFEEFFSTLERSWSDLCAFMGVSIVRPPSLGVVYNPGSTGIKSGLVRDILVQDLWWKKPFVKMLPASIKTKLRLKLDDWNKVAEETNMPAGTRKNLENIFSEDIHSLSALIGRDMKYIWSEPSS